MSSLAQEESRSISENVTWGHRKRFSDGKVSLPYGQFLGYEKGEDGLPKIVEKEAEVVRKIYRLFLEGKTPSGIAKELTEENIPTPGGKKVWYSSTVQSILQNEKYKGDALLQKSYTVDFLTKKKKINEGEVPQYYVENSHPAIIEPETFDLVQLEMKRRKEAKGYKTGGSCFSGKIVCGECGSFYGSKVWHSNSKYRRTIWQCNHKFKNEKKCKTPHIYEDQIKEGFIKVFNSLIENKEEIIMGYEVILEELLDTTKLEKKVATIQNEMEIVEELFRKMVDENSRKAMDQKEYSKKYNELVERYKKAQDELNEIEEKQQENKVRKDSIDIFIDRLKSQDTILTDFDEALWISTIEKVVIEDDNTFYFKDGTDLDELKAELEKIDGITVSTKDNYDGTKMAAAGDTTVSTVEDTTKEVGINVSSQKAADSAITTINDAIEKVSTERSKLGAMQNRLEHTIKNLDTSAENLQAAESRIRDVDMAKEMMEFTKQNILQQAATAMLAQANSLPQGVLQLLR